MKYDDDDNKDPRYSLIEGILYGLVIATFLWGMIIVSWLLLTT